MKIAILQIKMESEKVRWCNPRCIGACCRKRADWDKLEELLSQILQRLNELFVTDGLSEADMVNYAYAILDKARENSTVMDQVRNNAEQALLGDRVIFDLLLAGKGTPSQA